MFTSLSQTTHRSRKGFSRRIGASSSLDPEVQSSAEQVEPCKLKLLRNDEDEGRTGVAPGFHSGFHLKHTVCASHEDGRPRGRPSFLFLFFIFLFCGRILGDGR